MHIYTYDNEFQLESGGSLPGFQIGYNTYGSLNEVGDNVVWVCHALTANADPVSWWPGVVGPGCVIDPARYFIVCANILGSCYGSTGPDSVNPYTGAPYYESFPLLTIRDMVKAHILLRKHLKIDSIRLLMGGSMGGYQVLEWALAEPRVIQQLFLIATSAAESAWGQAIHAAQRMAIEADCSFYSTIGEKKGEMRLMGEKGLKAARAIGMLTYRNYGIMVERQKDPDTEKLENYRAASYLEHQGNKLSQRFTAHAYWLLTKAMDNHHIGRGRGGDLARVLNTIHQPTLIMGVSSDILCPPAEQLFMAENMPAAVYREIDSQYGHDGFLVEAAKISAELRNWLG